VCAEISAASKMLFVSFSPNKCSTFGKLCSLLFLRPCGGGERASVGFGLTRASQDAVLLLWRKMRTRTQPPE
jgi:hypothetical protein